MTNLATDPRQQMAKLAGVAYLFSLAIVVYANFGIYEPLHVAGNANETARRIADNKYLFRLGIVLDLIYAVGFATLLSSLYFVLKDVSRRLALLAAVWSLMYISAWVVITLDFYDALRLATGAKYLEAFADENLNALARLVLWARFDRYYGVLLFYSLGSMLFNLAWYKSGYIPKWLSLWGVIACAWCAVCAAGYLAYPELENILNIWLYDTPMSMYDLTLSIWLLSKGLNVKSV